MTDPRMSAGDRGFTVIEVVIAMTVLVIALLGAAALFGNAIIVSGNTRNRVVAQQIATKYIEKVRGQAADPTKFVAITAGGSDTPETVNGIKYSVHQDVQWTWTNSNQSACDSTAPSSPGNTPVLQATETVTWTGMAGTQPIKETTTLAAPVGAYSSNSGSIAVKVLDATGAPLSNINVRVQSVSGGTTDTQESTTQGCAFFYGVPAGTYSVSLIEGTGVGDQEVLIPSQQTSVTVGNTASLTFAYDTAGTLDVTGFANDSTDPAVSNLSLSVAATGLQPYGQYSFSPTITQYAGMTSLTPLFPYSSGYVPFAGACTDNNPLGKDTTGNLLYPTLAPTPVDVPAGGTGTATVNLYPVSLHVTLFGTAVNGATVSMTTPVYSQPSSVYGVNCTTGTANLATAPTLGWQGSTNATGDITAAIPLGHFKISVVKTGSPTRRGNVTVWSTPDGIYAVDAYGNPTTLYTGPITIPIS
jgi:prepilin-type N-terminal cleavage/methylation domain-containing protein